MLARLLMLLDDVYARCRLRVFCWRERALLRYVDMVMRHADAHAHDER